MKKISWIALCALLSAAVLTGCGAGESEPFEEKTYTAQAEQVQEVRLDVRDRSIEVSASEDGQITVSVNGGDIQFDSLDVEEKLDLQVKNGGISGTVMGGQSDYAVTCAVKKGESTLPAKADGGPKRLAVSANNGDVDIRFAG